MNFKHLFLLAFLLLMVIPANIVSADTGGTKFSPGEKVYSADRIKDHAKQNNVLRCDSEYGQGCMVDCETDAKCNIITIKVNDDGTITVKTGDGDGKPFNVKIRKLDKTFITSDGVKCHMEKKAPEGRKKIIKKIKDPKNPFRMATDYSERCDDFKSDKNYSDKEVRCDCSDCSDMEAWHGYWMGKTKGHKNPFRIAIDYSDKCDDDCCEEMKSLSDCHGDIGCGDMMDWGYGMDMEDIDIDECRIIVLKMDSDSDVDGKCGEVNLKDIDIDIEKLIEGSDTKVGMKIVICEVDEETGEVKIITKNLEMDCGSDADVCCKTGEKPDENCCLVNPDLECEFDDVCEKSGKTGSKKSE